MFPKGTSNRIWTMEGDWLSSSGQVRSKSGLVQVWSRSGPGLVHVWFSLQPKFNSFELDSEVGRLVLALMASKLILRKGFGE